MVFGRKLAKSRHGVENHCKKKAERAAAAQISKENLVLLPL
jgi:hypothetical protein